MKDYLAQQGDLFQINCKDHINTLAERYCTNHRSLICNECRHENHGDHNKQCLPINQASILEFFKEKFEKVQNFNGLINILLEKISNFLKKDKEFTSDEFIDLATELMNVCDLTDYLKKIIKEERKDSDYEWIHTDYIKPQHVTDPQSDSD